MNETSHERFAHMQKKVAKGYALSSFVQAEPHFDSLIRRLEFRVDQKVSKGNLIQLDQLFAFFAFDVVGQVTFSQPFGFLEQGTDIGACINNSHILVPYLTVMAYFHQYHDLLMTNPLTRWLDFQPMRHVMNTTTKAIQEREESTAVESDMMEHWMSQKIGSPLTRRELLSTATSNVAAGADNVGTELQAVVYLMLQNPRCLQTLRRELDSASASHTIVSPVQYDAAQNLTYFQACVSSTRLLTMSELTKFS